MYDVAIFIDSLKIFGSVLYNSEKMFTEINAKFSKKRNNFNNSVFHTDELQKYMPFQKKGRFFKIICCILGHFCNNSLSYGF